MNESMELEIKPSETTITRPSVVGLELPLAREKLKSTWKEKINLGKLLTFVASLYLFILAISLMKDGARGIAPWVRDSLAINSAANSLGFGWLFAYLIMSGSPVAAAALTFFDAGVIDKLGAFTMITGSRLGASFIVLFIGFLYILRGRDRSTSLSMGLFSLTVTATTYLPALFIGAVILRFGWLDSWQLQSGALLHSTIDFLVNPITQMAVHLLPNWMIFVLGLGVILVSFHLFDKCLPQMTIKESRVGWVSRLVYKPWVMFFLGAFVTLISMSVSISLSILVPLSARGFVRRENVIPYIMGANITTFIDTLLAAVLLSNPAAFTVVFVEMVSITLVSAIILALFYQRYQGLVLRSVEWITASNRNLAIFIGAIFCLPIILIIL